MTRTLWAAHRPILAALLVASAAVSASAQTPDTTFAADYGVVASTDSTLDSAPGLRAAFAAAKAHRQPGQRSIVVLPCHAPYHTSGLAVWYQGEIKVTDTDTELVGCGGTVVVRDTTEDGRVYYPVREVADYGLPESRLRLMPGAAGRPQPSIRGEFVNRIKVFPPRSNMTATGANGRSAAPAHFALRDLVLDGNPEGNLEAVRTLIDAGRGETLYRNSSAYTGLDVSRQDGNNVCRVTDRFLFNETTGKSVNYPVLGLGIEVEVEHVSVGGYASTGLLGDNGDCTRWTLTDVRAGNTAYNHVLYSPNGEWTNVTLYGYAWWHADMQGETTVTNLVYEDPAESPIKRDGRELVSVRRGTVTVHGLTVVPPFAEAPFRKAFGVHTEFGARLASTEALSVVPDVWTPPRPDPPAGPRYRIEPAPPVCREIATGLYVEFVPYCSSLPAPADD